MTHDRSLIEAFQRGEDFAFVSLYNRYKGPIYKFCVRMLLDRDAAQDAMQETFLRVFENRERLLKTDSFRAWLFSIARNQCLNMLRKGRRTVRLDSAVADRLRRQPAATLEKADQVAIVHYCLHELRPAYREVLVLREFQNLTYAEIAAVTKSTLPAVKSRLFKARRKLSAAMVPLMEREAERLATTLA